MSQKFGDVRKQFLIWFFANVLGFAALGIIILVFPFLITLSGFYTTTFFMAVPISIAQWIVLRRIFKTSGLWILTIPIGIPLSFYLFQAIPFALWPGYDDESIVGLTAAFLFIGTTIGLLQWLILRQQVSKAFLWILGSAIGIAGGFWLILVTEMIQHGVLAYIAIALVYSSVTGLFLAGLLPSQADMENAT